MPVVPITARVANIVPPDDHEMWSYVAGDGRRFLQFSAFSRICLGGALIFLGLRGDWLILLLPFGIGIVLGGIINVIWSTQIQPFDHEAHRSLVATGAKRAWSVDIFICTCGEDPAVVENTIMHATGLRHDGAVEVYVLDDRGIEEIRRAAELWGANYLATRPGVDEEIGEPALRVRAVVGPDRPRPRRRLRGPLRLPPTDASVLRRRRPRDPPDTAVLPHVQGQLGGAGRSRSAGAVLPDRPARPRPPRRRDLRRDERLVPPLGARRAGRHGAPRALRGHLHGHEGRRRRLPRRLPAAAPRGGLDAEQHGRARLTAVPLVRGNLALAGTPLFKRMRLHPMQRLGLWDGWIFYVTSALSPLVALFVPIVSLAQAPEAITLAPSAMVLPALFTEFYLQPRWLHLSDGRASRRVGLISQVAHLHALRDHLTDRDQEWIPTGGDRPSERRTGTDQIPDQIATCAVWGFVITLVLLGVRVATGWALTDLAPVGILAAIALPAALGTTRPAVDVPRPPAAPIVDEGRDPFLDVVRAISIVRVMFWHALGFWWISWTFAAMPAVFYVSGAVLAKSLRKASCWTVVKARLRRLIPPYLAYVTIAMATILLADPTAWANQTAHVVSWFLPYPRRRPDRLGGRLVVDAVVVPAGARGGAAPHAARASPRPAPVRSLHVRRLDRLVVRPRLVGGSPVERVVDGGRARDRRRGVLRRVLRARSECAPPALPAVAESALGTRRGLPDRGGRMGVRGAADRLGRQQLLRALGPRRPRLAPRDVGAGGPDPSRRRNRCDPPVRRLDHRPFDVDLPVAHAGPRARVLPRRRAELARSVHHPRRRVRGAVGVDRRGRRPARITRLATQGWCSEGACRADRAPRPRARGGDAAVATLSPIERGPRPAHSVGSSVRWRWSEPRRGGLGDYLGEHDEHGEHGFRGGQGGQGGDGPKWRSVVGRTRRRRRGRGRDRAADRRATSPRPVRRRRGARPRRRVRDAEHHQDDGCRGRTATRGRGEAHARWTAAARGRHRDRGHRHAHAAPVAEPLDGPPGLPREHRLPRRHDPDSRRGRQPRRVGERSHLDAHELRRTELPLGGVGDRDGHGSTTERGARRATVRTARHAPHAGRQQHAPRASSGTAQAVSCRRCRTSPSGTTP